VWGGIAYTRLGQQEDPTIPQRTAMLVTMFPGATASKVEELVSKQLERKISELKSIEEIKTESRPGISTLKIKQLPGSTATIDQQWDKVAPRFSRCSCPRGTSAVAEHDFGNTITLLLDWSVRPSRRPRCVARANLLQRSWRNCAGARFEQSRAVAAFSLISPGVSRGAQGRFEKLWPRAGLANKCGTPRTVVLLLTLTLDSAAALTEKFIADFTRTVTGTDASCFIPIFTQPLVLMGDEDPLPQIRAHAPPRYSYKTLELLARDFEDELKQVESVGKVTKVAIVQESVYLLYSDANLAGYGLTPKTVNDSIAARNAVIPGGTLRTEGRNFPVQLSGEYKTEHDMLGTIVGMSRQGAPVYLRDVFEVRRMYESPIPYKVDVLARNGESGPLDTRRAVMVAVEMRDGEIIRYFNRDVWKVADAMKQRSPEGLEFRVLSDSRPPSRIAFITSCAASSRR
jgi:multidrug efflux pump subunit AcrB